MGVIVTKTGWMYYTTRKDSRGSADYLRKTPLRSGLLGNKSDDGTNSFSENLKKNILFILLFFPLITQAQDTICSCPQSEYNYRVLPSLQDVFTIDFETDTNYSLKIRNGDLSTLYVQNMQYNSGITFFKLIAYNEIELLAKKNTFSIILNPCIQHVQPSTIPTYINTGENIIIKPGIVGVEINNANIEFSTISNTLFDSKNTIYITCKTMKYSQEDGVIIEQERVCNTKLHIKNSELNFTFNKVHLVNPKTDYPLVSQTQYPFFIIGTDSTYFGDMGYGYLHYNIYDTLISDFTGVLIPVLDVEIPFKKTKIHAKVTNLLVNNFVVTGELNLPLQVKYNNENNINENEITIATDYGLVKTNKKEIIQQLQKAGFKDITFNPFRDQRNIYFKF